jgi:hypothetical protein
VKKLTRIAASTALLLGLGSPGIVAATQGTIDTTGPGSVNQVNSTHNMDLDLENSNDVSASADVDQDATSGDAEVTTVTTAGNIETGSTDNSSMVRGSVDLKNSASADVAAALGNGNSPLTGSIKLTGPNSNNQVNDTTNTNVTVENENSVDISSSVDQDASSGEATVSNATTVGNVKTGSSSNSSTTTFDIKLAN